MGRRLVVGLDGTGNEIGIQFSISNVLKTFRVAEQGAGQRVYYGPGVGTIAQRSWWGSLRQQVHSVVGLAFGVGLDNNVLDAYAWLCRTYEDGDEIFLFGFSRGAYTARILAGFIHMVGLLHPDQLNLCGRALNAYKRSGEQGDLSLIWAFKGMCRGRDVRIRFVGVWDTVASLIVPRRDRLYLPGSIYLPFTRMNPSVQTFRQAISIDERRSMFRPYDWADPQPYRASSDLAQDTAQDIRQVWFAGVHADVGGAYPEEESGLSKYPFLWMVREAEAAGLEVDRRLKAHLVGAAGGRHSRHTYAPPDPAAPLHRSLAGLWWLLEAMPRYQAGLAWIKRRVLLGFFLPWAEPRPIPGRPWRGKPPDQSVLVHSSVLARIAACPDYRPVNLPAQFEVESAAGPPPPPIPPPPYRPPGALKRLGRLFATWPGPATWARLLALLLGLFAASWLLDRLGLVPWQPDLAFLLGIGAIAGLGTALAEETLFRGILLRPPADGATGLGPAALSAVVFALWHPLQTLFYHPLWEPYVWSWWFLAGTALLGFACARLTLSTRSIWPAAALHLAVALGWKTLYGIPSCGIAPCVLSN